MVPGGTNYSAVDSPGGPLLGGTNYSMTMQLFLFHPKNFDCSMQAKSPCESLFFTNRALCHFKLGQWASVVDDCQQALQLDSTLVKAHFFMGQALIELENYDGAIVSLKTGRFVIQLLLIPDPPRCLRMRLLLNIHVNYTLPLISVLPFLFPHN